MLKLTLKEGEKIRNRLNNLIKKELKRLTIQINEKIKNKDRYIFIDFSFNSLGIIIIRDERAQDTGKYVFQGVSIDKKDPRYMENNEKTIQNVLNIFEEELLNRSSFFGIKNNFETELKKILKFYIEYIKTFGLLNIPNIHTIDFNYKSNTKIGNFIIQSNINEFVQNQLSDINTFLKAVAIINSNSKNKYAICNINNKIKELNIKVIENSDFNQIQNIIQQYQKLYKMKIVLKLRNTYRLSLTDALIAIIALKNNIQGFEYITKKIAADMVSEIMEIKEMPNTNVNDFVFYINDKKIDLMLKIR